MTGSKAESGAPSVWPYPRWIAHRGAGKLAPENTMAAFRVGAEHGYRMFECDVKLSADGIPFLLHDAKLQRTTNGDGIAGDLAWHDLAQLDAGSWHSQRYAGESLPSLEGVARFCLDRHLCLNIEIKPTPGVERLTGEIVARHADLLWGPAMAAGAAPPLLSSFETAALAAALETRPGLPRGLLIDEFWPGWLDDAMTLQCSAVICKHSLWERSHVEELQRAGLRCLSYTVNDERSAQRLWDMGTDGIITDRIDLFSPSA